MEIMEKYLRQLSDSYDESEHMTPVASKRKKSNSIQEDQEKVKQTFDEFFAMDLMESINRGIREVEEENCNSIEGASFCDNRSEQDEEETNPSKNLHEDQNTFEKMRLSMKNQKTNKIITNSEEENILKDIQYKKQCFDDIDLLLDEDWNDCEIQAEDTNEGEAKTVPDVDDNIYIIEALISKKGSEYLVKWENYPEDQNTWEPQSSKVILVREDFNPLQHL